ncbi:MAG: hypothetical protein Q8L98_08800 [Chlamydiales bacterium]|nr:hypothetical protein [Chlamydiales bacterium]
MGDLLSSISVILFMIAGYMALTLVSFGSILAMILSWSRNSSVLWAIVHGWFSWLYVIYYCLRRKELSDS